LNHVDKEIGLGEQVFPVFKENRGRELESLIFGKFFENFKEGKQVLRALEKEIWTVKTIDDLWPFKV
jgi:hypothetical protein